tara:strand:- start:4058 stop:4579 length:522 start_codon:yes stop_codon:yes gene_type:complete
MMLRTDADHLPAPIRDELLHVVTILFEAFEETIKGRCSEHFRSGHILTLILHGPHAEKDWEEDAPGEAFRLLAIVNYTRLAAANAIGGWYVTACVARGSMAKLPGRCGWWSKALSGSWGRRAAVRHGSRTIAAYPQSPSGHRTGPRCHRLRTVRHQTAWRRQRPASTTPRRSK